MENLALGENGRGAVLPLPHEAVAELRRLSAKERYAEIVEEVMAQKECIERLMKEVFVEKVHYGVITGCKQPSLYKAGAEEICVRLNIGVGYEIHEQIITDGHVMYRVKAILTNRETGRFLGSAFGVCSSLENKYRERTIPAFAATPEEKEHGRPGERRQSKKTGNYYDTIIVTTNPHDLNNTILQMAQKRAHVAGTRTCTAVSSLFTQDVEDMGNSSQQEGGNDHGAAPEAATPPPAAAPKGGTTRQSTTRVAAPATPAAGKEAPAATPKADTGMEESEKIKETKAWLTRVLPDVNKRNPEKGLLLAEYLKTEHTLSNWNRMKAGVQGILGNN